MKLETLEKGLLDVYAVTESASGEWEPGWESLRTSVFGPLISRVPRSALNHVLNGLSGPFVAALVVPPEAALTKLPSPACAKQQGCPLYQKRRCILSCKKLPWCFEPKGVDELGSTTRRVAAECVFLWKEGVHVIAVYDDQ